MFFFFFQAEDGIRDYKVTGVQTCALPITASQPERGPAMTSTRATDRSFSASRRRLLQGAASTTALALAVPSLARAAEPIKVGVLQPLSGGLENLGQQSVQGTRLAIEEAN